MKIMIATPAFAGKVDIEYALSFAETKLHLSGLGIAIQTCINTSGSLLVAERNRIVEAFWVSDCTHLLCIDSDLGWPAQAIPAMLKTGKEFVAGLYPARGAENTFLFRPITHDNGSIVTEKHLLKMECVPAGFMLIAKSAIKKMREKHQDLYFEPKIKDKINSDSGYCFFNTGVWNGEFWGEDYVFCRKAREAGIEIWVDPYIQFNHAGVVGMFAELFSPQNKYSNATLSEVA
jgi:hypothetical protein